MFSVSRPIDGAVLNCCVTEKKETLYCSNESMILAKSNNERLRRSTMYTRTTSILPASISASSRLSRALHVAATCYPSPSRSRSQPPLKPPR